MIFVSSDVDPDPLDPYYGRLDGSGSVWRVFQSLSTAHKKYESILISWNSDPGSGSGSEWRILVTWIRIRIITHTDPHHCLQPHDWSGSAYGKSNVKMLKANRICPYTEPVIKIEHFSVLGQFLCNSYSPVAVPFWNNTFIIESETNNYTSLVVLPCL